MDSIFKKSINSHIEVVATLLNAPGYAESVAALGRLAVQTLRNGNKILLCGNGGSAADSQHIAAELVGRFGTDRPSLAAMSLTVDTSALTSIGNDYDFHSIYSRQVEGLGKGGDLLIGISTSGNSPNVIQAMEKARTMGLKTAGLTGAGKKPRILEVSDVCVCVPSAETARIQEAHILIGHIVCEYVEKEMFGR